MASQIPVRKDTWDWRKKPAQGVGEGHLSSMQESQEKGKV